MSLRLGVMGALGLALVACSGSKETDEASEAAATEKPVLTPKVEDTPVFLAEEDLSSVLAREAVHDWAEAWHGQTLIQPIQIFYGDVNGDGDAEALAFVSSQVGSAGQKIEAILFSKQGEVFSLDRVLGQISGAEPRNVRFLDGEISVTTSADAGEQDWTLPLEN